MWRVWITSIVTYRGAETRWRIRMWNYDLFNYIIDAGEEENREGQKRTGLSQHSPEDQEGSGGKEGRRKTHRREIGVDLGPEWWWTRYEDFLETVNQKKRESEGKCALNYQCKFFSISIGWWISRVRWVYHL